MPGRTQPLTAADVMSADVTTVEIDAPIEHASWLLRKNRVSGLPVIGKDGSVVGVVSETDFLYLGDPEVRGMIHHKTSGLRVGEIMSSPPVTVGAGTPLVEAARLMRDERIHRVIVVDGDDRPIGVVAASDFVLGIANGGLDDGPNKETT